MLHEISAFALKHWPLVGGFVVVLIWLIIEEAKSQGARGYVTVAQTTLLMNHENAIVRDASAYREGHIIGARSVPLVDFTRQLEKLSGDRERAIVLVDAAGLKAHVTGLQLKNAQFQKVFVLKGGMEQWKSENMPTVKGK